MSRRKLRIFLLCLLGGMGLGFLLIGLGVGALGHKAAIPQGGQEVMSVFLVFPLVFGGTGALMMLVGLGLFIGLGRSGRKQEELFRYGTIVQGVVTEIRPNYSVRVNGRSPWRVFVSCHDPNTRQDRLVRSHNVFDLTVQVGDVVRVAFDPLSERRYAIEIPEGSDRT